MQPAEKNISRQTHDVLQLYTLAGPVVVAMALDWVHLSMFTPVCEVVHI
jgi:hypothetical protein